MNKSRFFVSVRFLKDLSRSRSDLETAPELIIASNSLAIEEIWDIIEQSL